MPPVIRGRWPEGPEGESRRREASDFRSVIVGGRLCGFPPPPRAGLSGERFTMTRVHARSQQDEPATFWLSRLRKDRACVTAIALLAVFSSRSRGVGLTRLWIVRPAMPTAKRSAAG